MLEILIRCQEGVEVTSSKLQERTVSDALPAHRRNRTNLMIGQQPAERLRQAILRRAFEGKMVAQDVSLIP